MLVQAYGFVVTHTHFATDHFEGATLAADDGTYDEPKRVGDILTSDVYMGFTGDGKVGYIN